MWNGRHLKTPKIRDKCMAVRHYVLGITNFDMLFLVMGFISLVDEI